MTTWITFSSGCLIILGAFVFAWVWARKLDNYSLVDAVWAFGIGAVAAFWLVGSGGGTAKHWVAGALVLLWSLRLGWHLQRRIRRAHPEEDARYQVLREVWVGRAVSAFFWFFQAQALSVILLALPFFLVAVDRDGSWSLWESFGLAVVIVGIFGEGLADAQMTRFKASSSNPLAVCQVGLWRYSRHPNYFFEAVIWLGFYLYACGSAWGWTMLYAPVTIIYLLLRVTGIPPTEAAAVRRRGDAYRRYQQTTSAFIPWPPKRDEPTNF